jgi:hypothetical protein
MDSNFSAMDSKNLLKKLLAGLHDDFNKVYYKLFGFFMPVISNNPAGQKKVMRSMILQL